MMRRVLWGATAVVAATMLAAGPADAFEVIVPCLPGFGFSTPLAGEFTSSTVCPRKSVMRPSDWPF